MNPQEVSWIDVVTPIITFVLVIVLPSIVAGWVILRTLTEKPDPDAEAAAEAEDGATE